MAIQIQGNGGVIAEVDGTTFRAVRTVPKPVEYGAFGHYRVAATVGLLATQAANGTLFSFRWGDASRFAVVTKLRLSVLQTAAATATIMPSFQAFIARSFTVSDSAGTAVTLTGNNMKKRTSMGTSLVTDIRFSAATAGLTAGTRTLDASPVLLMPTQQAITTPNATLYQVELDVGVGDGNHPIVLAQNEGLIVQGPTVIFGAAGTANLVVDMSWAEVAAY
jgi:hypothetical protein